MNSRSDTEVPTALEDQRQFLLQSLDDLEAEFAAGDLSEADYSELKSDYTRRAAAAIRSIDSEATAPSSSTSRNWRLVVAWIVGTIAFAGMAGTLVAELSGSRGADGSITGDIRLTTREMIFDAQTTFVAGDLDGALAIYDEVLEMQPSNIEALTYRGWLTSRSGDLAAAVPYLDDAIALDPDYPAAHLFRSIVALDLGDGELAASELAAFDALDPPVFAEALILDSRLRERVALQEELASLVDVSAVFFVDDPPAFSDTDLTVSHVSQAAEQLAVQNRMLDGVELFQWVLDSEPDNADALAGRGWLIARSGDDELLDRGIEYLDQALAEEADHPDALVFRSFSLNERGDVEAARADLVAFDALVDQPAELVRLIDNFGLRVALAG